MPNHPQFKDDDVKEGKMPEGLKKYLEKKQGKKEVKEALGSNFFKKLKLKKGSQMQQKLDPTAKQKQANLDQENLNRKFDKSHYEPQGNPLQEEEKAPRMQKGAMAYDGPNKERSEAADRVLAKTKKKREKMNEMSCPSPKVVETSSKSKEKKMTPSILDKIRKLNTGAGSQFEQVVHEKMDPVGQEDKDIDNDGDHDSTDKYLANRRKAIGKAIAKKRGRVKEGFSAWRVELDFNEQVKK